MAEKAESPCLSKQDIIEGLKNLQSGEIVLPDGSSHHVDESNMESLADQILLMSETTEKDKEIGASEEIPEEEMTVATPKATPEVIAGPDILSKATEKIENSEDSLDEDEKLQKDGSPKQEQPTENPVIRTDSPHKTTEKPIEIDVTGVAGPSSDLSTPTGNANLDDKMATSSQDITPRPSPVEIDCLKLDADPPIKYDLDNQDNPSYVPENLEKPPGVMVYEGMWLATPNRSVAGDIHGPKRDVARFGPKNLIEIYKSTETRKKVFCIPYFSDPGNFNLDIEPVFVPSLNQYVFRIIWRSSTTANPSYNYVWYGEKNLIWVSPRGKLEENVLVTPPETKPDGSKSTRHSDRVAKEMLSNGWSFSVCKKIAKDDIVPYMYKYYRVYENRATDYGVYAVLCDEKTGDYQVVGGVALTIMDCSFFNYESLDVPTFKFAKIHKLVHTLRNQNREAARGGRLTKVLNPFAKMIVNADSTANVSSAIQTVIEGGQNDRIQSRNLEEKPDLMVKPAPKKKRRNSDVSNISDDRASNYKFRMDNRSPTYDELLYECQQYKRIISAHGLENEILRTAAETARDNIDISSKTMNEERYKMTDVVDQLKSASTRVDYKLEKLEKKYEAQSDATYGRMENFMNRVEERFLFGLTADPKPHGTPLKLPHSMLSDALSSAEKERRKREETRIGTPTSLFKTVNPDGSVIDVSIDSDEKASSSEPVVPTIPLPNDAASAFAAEQELKKRQNIESAVESPKAIPKSPETPRPELDYPNEPSSSQFQTPLPVELVTDDSDNDSEPDWSIELPDMALNDWILPIKKGVVQTSGLKPMEFTSKIPPKGGPNHGQRTKGKGEHPYVDANQRANVFKFHHPQLFTRCRQKYLLKALEWTASGNIKKNVDTHVRGAFWYLFKNMYEKNRPPELEDHDDVRIAVNRTIFVMNEMNNKQPTLTDQLCALKMYTSIESCAIGALTMGIPYNPPDINTGLQALLKDFKIQKVNKQDKGYLQKPGTAMSEECASQPDILEAGAVGPFDISPSARERRSRACREFMKNRAEFDSRLLKRRKERKSEKDKVKQELLEKQSNSSKQSSSKRSQSKSKELKTPLVQTPKDEVMKMDYAHLQQYCLSLKAAAASQSASPLAAAVPLPAAPTVPLPAAPTVPLQAEKKAKKLSATQVEKQKLKAAYEKPAAKKKKKESTSGSSSEEEEIPMITKKKKKKRRHRSPSSSDSQ